MNIQSPWDRTNYIYNTDLLFNKNKNEKEKKATILDLIDFESKKDNNVNNIDNLCTITINLKLTTKKLL